MLEIKTTFTVQLLMPNGSTYNDGLAFIKSAIVSTCATLNPDDPMFDLEVESVNVSRSLTPCATSEPVTKAGAPTNL